MTQFNEDMMANTERVYRHTLQQVGAMVRDLNVGGRVVAVSDKAVNIRLPQRLLVSLVADARKMTPMAVLCPHLFSGPGPQCRQFLAGHTMRIGSGWMTMGSLRMDLQTAPKYSGHANPGRTRCLDADKILAARHALSLVGRKGGLLGLIDPGQAGNPFAREGLSVWRQLSTAPLDRRAQILARFVGLGPGLTPSGDDLLCGFLLGDALAAGAAGQTALHPDPGAFSPLNPREKEILWQAAGRTTDAGRTLIWMALKSRFAAFLLEAIEALGAAAGPGAVFRAVSAAVASGHTSGTDALVGLLLYLQNPSLSARGAGRSGPARF